MSRAKNAPVCVAIVNLVGFASTSLSNVKGLHMVVLFFIVDGLVICWGIISGTKDLT